VRADGGKVYEPEHQRGGCGLSALIFNLVLMAFPAIFAGF